MARLVSRDALRGVGLISAAAIVLHQLRYKFGYGSEAPQALEAQGHAYLTGMLPEIAGALVFLIVASLATSLVTGVREFDAPRPGWLVWSMSILTVYSAQEVTEGVLAAGHPSGIAALGAGSGWIAFPLALLVGCCAARLWRWLEHTESLIASALPMRKLPRPPLRDGQPKADSKTISTQLQGLSFGFARRPPPLTS